MESKVKITSMEGYNEVLDLLSYAPDNKEARENALEGLMYSLLSM